MTTANPTLTDGRAVLHASSIDAAARLLEWLRSFIAQPHPDLGRDGSICPFVPTALYKDSIHLVLHEDIDGRNPAAVRSVLLQGLHTFSALPHVNDPGNILTALLLVFPNIHDNHATILDEVFAELKTGVVRKGLMMGQFHPACPEPATRNPALPIARSPIPFVAIRKMTLHDILFLSGQKSWFDEYERRFGEKYRRGQVSTPLYLDRFTAAWRQYRPGTPASITHPAACPARG